MRALEEYFIFIHYISSTAVEGTIVNIQKEDYNNEAATVIFQKEDDIEQEDSNERNSIENVLKRRE